MNYPNLTMEYSQERNTWNLIDLDTNEWIAEGNFEYVERMLNNAYDCYNEEQDSYYEEYDYPEELFEEEV